MVRALIFLSFCGLLIGWSTPAQAGPPEQVCARTMAAVPGTLWTHSQIAFFCRCFAQRLAQSSLPQTVKDKFTERFYEETHAPLNLPRFCIGCSDSQFQAFDSLSDIYLACSIGAAKIR